MADARKPNSDTLGPNAWLVDEMFEQFRTDPTSVSESWREFFEGYKPGGANLVRRPVLLPNGDGAPNVGEGPNGAGPAGYGGDVYKRQSLLVGDLLPEAPFATAAAFLAVPAVGGAFLARLAPSSRAAACLAAVAAFRCV